MRSAMPKKHQRAPHQADTRNSPWAGIPHAVLKSDAYVDLSTHARAILFEIVLQFNGRNNGAIGVGYAHLAKRLNNTNKTRIKKSLVELMSNGFISTEAEADWKGRRVREYRLTFVNTTPSGRHKAATNDYRDWVKPKQKPGSASLPLTQINGKAPLPLREKNGNTSLPNKFEELRKTAEKSHVDGSKNGNAPLPHINTIPLVEKTKAQTGTHLTQPHDKARNEAAGFDSTVRAQISKGWNALSSSAKIKLAQRHGVSEHEVETYLRGEQEFSAAKLMAIRSDLSPR